MSTPPFSPLSFSPRRRAHLKRLAALGLLGPAGISGLIQEALAKGDLPAIAGVNTLSGTATVNDQPAKVGMPVKPGDRVATGKGSYAVIVLGKDAYLLRDSTSVVFEPNKDQPGVLESVLIATGKVLSVFEKRPAGAGIRIKAQAATIGIRGTGCYIEIQERRTYFCLCYGEAAVDGGGMAATKIIKTTHHENPVWLDEHGGIMKVEDAGFANHSDDELVMLEKLIGRQPPFASQPSGRRY